MDPNNKRYADAPLSTDPEIAEGQLDCRHALPTPISETIFNALKKFGKAVTHIFS